MVNEWNFISTTKPDALQTEITTHFYGILWSQSQFAIASEIYIRTILLVNIAFVAANGVTLPKYITSVIFIDSKQFQWCINVANDIVSHWTSSDVCLWSLGVCGVCLQSICNLIKIIIIMAYAHTCHNIICIVSSLPFLCTSCSCFQAHILIDPFINQSSYFRRKSTFDWNDISANINTYTIVHYRALHSFGVIYHLLLLLVMKSFESGERKKKR